MVGRKKSKEKGNRLLLERLRESEKRFYDLMKRAPVDGDPIVFESYLYSSAEFRRDTIKVMIEARTRGELIYIFDKTGFMPSEMNIDKFSAEDREEIDSAFDEYFENPEEFEYREEDYNDRNIMNDMDSVIPLYILGNFIDRNFNESVIKRNFRNILFYYITLRIYRLLKAIYKLRYASSVDERYVLLRSLFENYCKLCFVERSEVRAKRLFDMDYGLASGEYSYQVREGKINRSKIKNLKTGECIDRNVSFFSMISYSKHKQDVELFPSVYEFLSSFAHSGTRYIFRNFDPETYGFSVLGKDDEEQAEVGFRFMMGMIVAIVLQKLHGQRNISKVSKRDIEYFCYVSKIMAKNSSVADGDHLLKNERQAFGLMLDRMKILPKRRNFRERPSNRDHETI